MSRNLKTPASGGNESGTSAIILSLFAAKEALKNYTNTEKTPVHGVEIPMYS